MNPRLRAYLPLRFADDLSAKEFECLCRDLVAKESHISSAARYGKSPQRQLGVDIVSFYQHADGCDALQCKNYKEFGKKHLKTAIKAFRTATKHWQEKAVHRFVLCVGSSCSDTVLQDEYFKQRQIFFAENIAFDLWDDAEITAKLAPHRDIALRYFDKAIVDQICPSVESVQGPNAALNLSNSVLNECGSEFENSLETELPRLRELMREGRQECAFAELQEFISSPRWRLLTQTTQARCLALAASLHLDVRDDLESAKRLLSEVAKLSSSEPIQHIAACVVFREQGIAAALNALNPPSDVSAWNIWLALMTESRRFGEVIESVERPLFPPNGGSFRIASIAAVLSDDMVKAQRFSDEAVATSPNWFQVRFQAARMKYLSAILPSFPAFGHLSWPIPPDSEYIKRDAASVANLRAAETEFAALAELDSTEQREIETWRLACVANLPDGREAAAKIAAELLTQQPDHLPAAVWCLQRGYAFDRSTILAAITNSDKDQTVDSSQAICHAHIQAGDFEAAIASWEAKKSAFTKAGAEFHWRHMRAQLAALRGDDKDTQIFIDAEPDERNRWDIKFAAARVHVLRSGSYATLAALAIEAYRATTNPRFLFEGIESFIQAGDYRAALEWGEEVLNHFPTASALRMILHAAFHAGAFGQFLQWIRSRRTYFAEGAVPVPVRRQEVGSLWQVGEFKEALERANALVRESPDAENHFALFGAQLASADLRASVQSARHLISIEGVSASGLLYLAYNIWTEDIALARNALKLAISRGVGDDAVVGAVHLGFQIGAEATIAPLMPRFYALAKRSESGVEAVPFEKCIEIQRGAVRYQQEVSRIYGEGQVPVHQAAKQLNVPLAILMHENPRVARESQNSARELPTLIRSGGRICGESPRFHAGELFMDITSILIAEDMGLLAMIESDFAPIHISSHLLDSLKTQIAKSAPNQPSRKTPRDQIMRLVEKKRIHVATTAASEDLLSRYGNQLGERWCKLMTHAHAVNGMVCDYVPPLTFSGGTAALTPEDARRVASGSDIVRALNRANAISDEEATSMLKLLGEANAPFQPELQLQANTTLFLDGGIAESLAIAGALEPIASFLHVEISEDELLQLRADSDADQRRTAVAEWLKTLTERISHGLATGIYANVLRDGATDDTANEGPDEKCLRDLLSASACGAKIVWCDDRMISNFKTCGELPSYGVLDILQSLRDSNRIGDGKYYEYLLFLRQSNARYISLKKGEILHHLFRAPISNGKLSETEAMVTLRRYVAACCLDRFRLRPPVKDQQGNFHIAEYQWALDNQRATAAALAGIWKLNGVAESDRHLRAEWILDQIVIPVTGFIEAHSGNSQPNMADGVAGVVSYLFIEGFKFPEFSLDKSHPRARLYDWVGKRILEPLNRVEPSVIEKIAKPLAKSLLKRIPGLTGKEDREMRNALIRWFSDVPDVLRVAMPIPASVRNWLGIRTENWAVGVFGKEFSHDEFWRALFMAATGTQSIATASDDTEFTFSPPEPRQRIYRIPISGSNIHPKARIVEPKLLALIGDANSQRTYMELRRDWFDYPAEKITATFRKITRTKDPVLRSRLIQEAMDDSAENFYRNLLKRIRDNKSITPDESFPASPEVLLRHIRFREEPDWDSRAKRLINEVGLSWTIERFAALPITMPEPIQEAFRSLDSSERRRLMSRLRRRIRNPIGRLHLAHLLILAACVEPGYLDEAKSVSAGLFEIGENRDKWKAFRAVHEWTRRFVLTLHRYRPISDAERLVIVWLHAGRLHQMMELGDADCSLVRDAFTQTAEPIGIAMDYHLQSFNQDCAHPQRNQRVATLLRGIGAALQTVPLEVSTPIQTNLVSTLFGTERLTSSAGCLIQETSALPNALNSFLGEDGVPLLCAALGAEFLHSLLPKKPSELIDAALSELKVSVHNLEAWKILVATTEWNVLPTHQGDALENVLAGVNFEDFKLEGEESTKLLIYFSARCAVNPSSAIRDKCELLIYERARVAAKENLEGEPLRQRVGTLAGCLMLLAVVPNNEAGTNERMHKLLVSFIQAWPAAATVLRRRFDGWPTFHSLARQRGFWELEMTLRAIL